MSKKMADILSALRGGVIPGSDQDPFEEAIKARLRKEKRAEVARYYNNLLEKLYSDRLRIRAARRSARRALRG